jgi:hypothetical protein
MARWWRGITAQVRTVILRSARGLGLGRNLSRRAAEFLCNSLLGDPPVNCAPAPTRLVVISIAGWMNHQQNI